MRNGSNINSNAIATYSQKHARGDLHRLRRVKQMYLFLTSHSEM